MQPSISNAQDKSSSATTHPALDTWIAYHGGGLPEVQERRLRDHLAGCRHCVHLLLDLDDFNTHRPQDSAVSNFSKAATWRLLRDQMRSERPAAMRWLPSRVAAAVLVGALGLSGWGLIQQQSELRELHNRVAALAQPQANAPIFDLRPGGSLRSRQHQAQRLLVPAGSGFTLILNLLETDPAALFRARILDASQQPIATIEGLRPDELHTLTLLIPAGRLAAGSYRVELHVADEAPPNLPVESYSVEIVRP